MFGLYGWLLTKGQVVHINGKYAHDDFIAIYPEIIHGNPLGAKHVVRYILNEPGVMATGGVPGPTEFEETDYLYVFSEMFNKKLKLPGSKKLFLPILDTFLFKDQGRNRPKTAVFVGKGTNTGEHPKGSRIINRGLASDQGALADVLNQCHTLYQYDPISAMSEIARLCGCKVRLIQDRFTKTVYRDYEPGINGISFREDEDVPLETEGFADHYHRMKGDFSRRLDKFIEFTQAL